MATTSLARRFRLDVSADAASWLRLNSMTDFNPQISPNKVDATTFDDNGATAMEIVSNSFLITAKVLRQPIAGVYDPGQELVRACQSQYGDAARVYVRYYDKFTGLEGKQGRTIAEWNESKTGQADLNEIQITLTGDGAISSIGPVTVTPPAPLVLTATPAAVAVGGIVQITGAGFTGTIAVSGVKFGATNATSWFVVSDSVIVAVMPAGSAGAANIVVTNAAGASTALPYTRGA